MSGDIKFVTKILSKRPDLALKQDAQGLTPLHLASVRKSPQMVDLLLRVGTAACIVQGRDGRTPLHLAAMNNRVGNIELLMERGLPEAIHLKNDQNGETILHFCVRSNSSLETVELLVNKLLRLPLPGQNPNPISINSTDYDGNTILHLAAEIGNMEITNFLLLNSDIRVDIDVVNQKGHRALNMLSQAERNDLESGSYDYYVRHKTRKGKTLSKNGDENEGLKERVNALIVVATLIAGIAFQAAMNPPGGVWQDDSIVNSSTDPVKFAYYLDHMFDSFLPDSWDTYIVKKLEGLERFNQSNGGGKGRNYSNIEHFVMDLMDIIYSDIYYEMIAEGLILEDFEFITSNNEKRDNSSRGSFFPYLIRYAGNPILAYTSPDHYLIYMITNSVAFFGSLTIIFLVICGFVNETSLTQVRILVVLMCISIVCIAFGYFFIFEAMVPEFYTGVSAILGFGLFVFCGVCCLVGAGLFFWTLKWKIVKLRKRTRHHHIGVINYLKALFYGMDASATGKLVFFCWLLRCLSWDWMALLR
ncbi:hypothetical protein MKX03_021334 [Papaver bracteatum]|nr:hypothetical protein MKX03_021334 [Papaver bracteatum]